eukprot:scaffold2151_cov178-Alexandrium_tamarense.AAC.14
MSATATLTNCYVPLPLMSPSSSAASFDPQARVLSDVMADGDGNSLTTLSSDGNTHKTSSINISRSSKRGPRTLRQLHLARSILSQSTGSSLVECGHTKLIVSVRGPRPANCGGLNGGNGGGLICEVRYMPHIGIRMETLARHSLSHDFSKSSSSSTGARIPRDSLSTSQDTSNLSSGGALCAPAAFLDESYLSHRLQEALAPAVVLMDNENKMCIEVFVQVLQSDGGVFGAAVMGASLALVDAGVGMRDVVCGSSAAVMKVVEEGDGAKNGTKSKYVAIADPSEDEILQASGVVTIAIMPNWREVTVWDQFGKMPVESSQEAMELAREGCVTMHKFLKKCVLDGGGE